MAVKAHRIFPVTSGGRAAANSPTTQQFGVDHESAYMIAEFEAGKLREMQDGGGAGLLTAGNRWYAQYGQLMLSVRRRLSTMTLQDAQRMRTTSA
ncbi:hypothetical protein UB46_14220 [Burkholderiaceae bacterium 16]|nr:hypothetical protein UB46_14220 [Burkholderiaceae bacterium 16]